MYVDGQRRRNTRIESARMQVMPAGPPEQGWRVSDGAIRFRARIRVGYPHEWKR